jgi:hypothetical protein
MRTHRGYRPRRRPQSQTARWMPTGRGELRSSHAIGNAFAVAPGLSSPSATKAPLGPKPDPAQGPGGGRRRRRRELRARRHSFPGRHPLATGALVVAVLFSPVWVSLGSALKNPALGNSASARLAEWSRDHGAGGLVTWIENLYYSHHAPPAGGKPPAGAIPPRSPHPAVTRASLSLRVRKGALTAPVSLAPFPRTPLLGEGEWVPAGRLVDGLPAVYTTFMRPDAVHTSVIDGVAWIDTKLLSVRLYSGSYIPGGGPFKYNTPLPLGAEASLVAAFNGGFRLADSQAGYYTGGVTVRPLVDGAASLVIYNDGTATVGAWGTEVKMTPDVVSVRQELRLLVDNGTMAPGLAANERGHWGSVLGNSVFVSRSGVGVTKDGALVFVGGPDLDAVNLARLLLRAGAVRAMELDINSDWVNFATFDPGPDGLATAANARDLLPAADMSGAYRYFVSYWERDFFTLSARQKPLG